MSTRPLRILLVGLAVSAAALSAMFLPIVMPGMDNSPDENANRFFAVRFAEDGQLSSAEPLLAVAPGVVHPRSMRAIGTSLVPVGFIGLPVLYGGIARIIGTWSIPWITPVVAAMAALAWAGIVTRLTSRRVGILAGVLLALQPAWWYAASRTLQPNVLFLSLLILATWCFVNADPPRERRNAAFAGILLGLALATRLAEAPWIGLAAAVLLLALGNRAAWRRTAIAAVFAALTLVPFFLAQQQLYGGVFATGYGNDVTSEVVGAATGGKAAQLLGPLRPYLFPLGLAPRIAVHNFATYGIAFFWWWSALVGVALVFYGILATRRVIPVTKRASALFGATMLVSVWLILFYGSWVISDTPDPNAITIGSSYLRYWLPIFAVSTLPVAWLFDRVAAALKPRATKALLAGLLLGTGIVSGVHVFSAPGDGLLAVQESLVRYGKEREAILALTEPDAVIVADRADKFLFPQRSIVHPLRSEATYAALPALVAATPTYYVGVTFPDTDLAWLNTVKLPPLGLVIAPVRSFADETLYRFSPLSP
jgi:4-amino-4-deoxy-L-arabinose transferase-like glycosyltransferase